MMNSRVRSTPARGPRLVALLDLEVVEDQRQVAVGAHLARDVERDRLLVRHRQHQRALVAVLELEQLRDLAAAGAVPQLRAAGAPASASRGAPIASISSRRICSTRRCARHPAGRKVHMPGAQLAHEPGAHHQDVRDRLGVGGRFLQRRQEIAGKAGHRERRCYRRAPRFAAPYRDRGSIGPTVCTVTCSGKRACAPGPGRDLSPARLFRRLCCPAFARQQRCVAAVRLRLLALALGCPAPRCGRRRRPPGALYTNGPSGRFLLDGDVVPACRPARPRVRRAAGSARARCAGWRTDDGARTPPTRATSRRAATRAACGGTARTSRPPAARRPTGCCASSRSTTARPSG